MFEVILYIGAGRSVHENGGIDLLVHTFLYQGGMIVAGVQRNESCPIFVFGGAVFRFRLLSVRAGRHNQQTNDQR